MSLWVYLAHPHPCTFQQPHLSACTLQSGVFTQLSEKEQIVLWALAKQTFFPECPPVRTAISGEHHAIVCQTTPDRDVKQSRTANRVVSPCPGHFMRQHFPHCLQAGEFPVGQRWISPSPNALTHNGSGAAGWGSSTSVMDMGSVGASLLALGYRNWTEAPKPQFRYSNWTP